MDKSLLIQIHIRCESSFADGALELIFILMIKGRLIFGFEHYENLMWKIPKQSTTSLKLLFITDCLVNTGKHKFHVIYHVKGEKKKACVVSCVQARVCFGCFIFHSQIKVHLINEPQNTYHCTISCSHQSQPLKTQAWDQ